MQNCSEAFSGKFSQLGRYLSGLWFIMCPREHQKGGKHMSPMERRQELLEVLCHRRHTTCNNLANEFNVSEQTIRRDIAVLMCSYPIETVCGGHGGGVKIADGFYLNGQRRQRRWLTPKQAALLRELSNRLDGDDLDTLNAILLQFAP